MTKEQMYLLGFNTAIDRMVEECEEKTDYGYYIYMGTVEEIAEELKERVNGKVETVPKMR